MSYDQKVQIEVNGTLAEDIIIDFINDLINKLGIADKELNGEAIYQKACIIGSYEGTDAFDDFISSVIKMLDGDPKDLEKLFI